MTKINKEIESILWVNMDATEIIQSLFYIKKDKKKCPSKE